jgi:type I restriction enzyme M protein
MKKKNKNNIPINPDAAKEALELIENYAAEPEKYRPILEKLLAENPDSWGFRRMLADIKSNDPTTLSEAIQEYSKCIELQPESSLLYYSRAISYEKQEDYGKALIDIQEAKKHSEEKSYFSERFRLEIKLGNYDNAWELYEGTDYQEYYDDAEQLFELAQYYIKNESIEKALDILESMKFVDGGSRFDMWDPQDEIDGIKEELHKQEIDNLRNVKFASADKLRELFFDCLYITIDYDRNTVPEYESFLDVAKIIYLKRLHDINAELDDESPYTDVKFMELLETPRLHKRKLTTKSASKANDNSSSLQFSGLYDSCLNITSLDKKVLLTIIKAIDRNIFSIENISTHTFGIAFNSFINHAQVNDDYSRIAEYASSRLVQRIMNDNLQFGKGDRVFDPAMGFGRLLINEQFNEHDHLKQVKTKPVGNELNSQVSILGKINLVLNGITDFDVQTADSLSVVQSIGDCDYAVCQPPFAGRRNYLQSTSDSEIPKIVNVEFAFLQVMLSRLKVEGRFAIVLPLSLLSQTGKAAEYRKHLVKNDLIDQVIGLPEGALGDKSSKSVILFGTKRKRARKQPIIMFIREHAFDYTMFGSSKLVGNADHPATVGTELQCSSIEELDMLLDPVALNQPNILEAISLYTGTSKSYRSIRNITTRTLRGRALNPKLKEASKHIPFIKVGDLKEDELDNTLSEIAGGPEGKDNPKILNESINKSLIREDCVLVSLVGEKLKPTIFKYAGTPILINQNILALFPILSEVTLEFLARELKTERVLRQVDLVRTRGVVSNLKVVSFKKIRLDVPDKNEQERRLEDLRDYIVNQKLASDSTFRLALEKARKEFNDGLGLIRHQLGQIIGTASLNTDSLHYFLKSNHPQILDDSIVPLEDGQAPNQAQTVDGVLNQMKSSFTKMSNEMRTIQLITKGLKEGVKPEVVTIKQLFNEKILEHELENVNIQIGKLKEEQILDFTIDAQILADKAMLGSALDQIILNAIKHGKREDKVLNIWLDYTQYLILEEEIYHEISIRNDGHPLPPQFSLELYSEIGGSIGVTGNSGIGGYVIAKIAEMHDGKLRAQNLPTGQVEISILLLTGITLDEINWTD